MFIKLLRPIKKAIGKLFNFTHLSSNEAGIGTFIFLGCQDIKGPVPPSFLISLCKLIAFFYTKQADSLFFLKFANQLKKFKDITYFF